MPSPLPQVRTRRWQWAMASACLLALVTVAGCDNSLTGTYQSADGAGSLEFRGDGTVYVTALGSTFAATYQIDGEKVIVQGPNGSQVLTLTGDRLEGGFGTTFIRQ